MANYLVRKIFYALCQIWRVIAELALDVAHQWAVDGVLEALQWLMNHLAGA